MNLCNKVRNSIESSDIVILVFNQKTTCNTDNNFTNDILHEVRLLRKEKTKEREKNKCKKKDMMKERKKERER